MRCLWRDDLRLHQGGVACPDWFAPVELSYRFTTTGTNRTSRGCVPAVPSSVSSTSTPKMSANGTTTSLCRVPRREQSPSARSGRSLTLVIRADLQAHRVPALTGKPSAGGSTCTLFKIMFINDLIIKL